MRVLHVNRSLARTVRVDGHELMTGILKRAVEAPVAVGLLGLEGDEQADLSVHGGISKAVYAYPHEHYAFWQTVRAQAGVAAWDATLDPGSMGENLTVQGLAEDRLWIGDRLVLPGCVLAVSEPRFPCNKFTAVMGFRHAAKMMAQSGFCGSYLGVIEPGTVSAGDPIELRPGPRQVNLRELFRSRIGA